MRFAILEKTFAAVRPEGYKMTSNEWLLSTPRWKQWVVRKIWNWMIRSKFLTPFHYTVPEYSFGKPEQQQVVDAVLKQIGQMLEAGYLAKDLTIVVGAEFFRELTDAVLQSGIDLIADEVTIRHYSDGRKMTLRNIPVYVLPYHDGACVIPKFLVTKPRGKTPLADAFEERMGRSFGTP